MRGRVLGGGGPLPHFPAISRAHAAGGRDGEGHQLPCGPQTEDQERLSPVSHCWVKNFAPGPAG